MKFRSPTGHFHQEPPLVISLLEIGIRTKYVWKTWSQHNNSNICWVNSCNDSLFSGMIHCTRAKFTVLMSCSGELLTVHSYPLYLPAEAVCESWQWTFYYWPSLCDGNMATNLQRFTSSCGSRHFAARDYWTYRHFSRECSETGLPDSFFWRQI